MFITCEMRRKFSVILSKKYNFRFLASSPVFVEATDLNNVSPIGWEQAKSFESIPRPTKWEFVRGYFPGGRYYKKTMNEVNDQWRTEFGDIFLIPGLFGKRDILFTFNPEDFKTVFRHEGIYPIRRGLDVITYYRKNFRPEIYKESAGLVSDHGEEWGKFRSTVNPVLMNPKTFRLYAPKMNSVADQLIARIRKIRDPKSQEMPENFESEINNWAMESAGIVALDTQLGLIDQSVTDMKMKAFIDRLRQFFELMFQLEMKPSIWKYISTPDFRKFVATSNVLTDIGIHYVAEAKSRIEAEEAKGIIKTDAERSILERLIKINPKLATVMAMDIILAGVETTTCGLVSCLLSLAKNPEKQENLRKEVVKALPEKGATLTVEKMHNLPYLRACIKEALRYYPVATANFRTAGQDVILSGYQVPKDTDVAMPNQTLMRDEEYYVAANDYLPERWLRGDDGNDASGCPLNKKMPFVFLPFGFGPRMCIGKRLVDLELEVTLTKLIRNFEIDYDYSTENFFKAHMHNIPGKPLKFKFVELKK